MVADALQILGDHQQIQRRAALLRVGGDAADQCLLHLFKIVVHRVVGGDDLLGQRHILPHIGIHAVTDHADGGLRHLAQQRVALRRYALQIQHDLGDVVGLIADALHIRDHLQRGGNTPQVAGHRLLVQQQPQAQVFNVPLLPVDVPIQRRHLLRQRLVPRGQRPGGQRDYPLTQRAHLDELPVQLGQLLVKTAPHYPNLPVM